MKDGFVKVAVSSPDVVVADPDANSKKMIEKAEAMAACGVRLVVFPEMSITGYTCGDLFLQDTLLDGAKEALFDYLYQTAELDIVSVVGMPLEHRGKLYNVAVVASGGHILGVVPKTYLPDFGEHHEGRCFTPGRPNMGEINIGDEVVPFGTSLLFRDAWSSCFTFAVEICEDLRALNPPSTQHAAAGALIIANPSASCEIVGKADYRRMIIKAQSARTLSAYLFADTGFGESTSDLVYSSHNLIAENGVILLENSPFDKNRDLMMEIDLHYLRNQRRRISTFEQADEEDVYRVVTFDIGAPVETPLTRHYSKTPFVAEDEKELIETARTVINVQSASLYKRFSHTGCKNALIGVSGGLDSTLALLVTAHAFDKLGYDRKGIYAITMPGFGTTERTHNNAEDLAKALGTTFMEIDIKESVRRHFSDIGQDESVHDVTYENAQARERTQVLMDYANKVGGLVVGTGDMSELALGWATYNGDHMSMYGVNASVPKTLIRHLVKYMADTAEDEKLSKVLYDILDTPVSPELLPPENGVISQETENIVGPYELHDFFAYHMHRTGATTGKILRLAKYAFNGEYDEETIKKWLNIFMRRFFSQQYKRSCSADGPKVGTVGLSPKDWMMPSDACGRLWGLDN